MKNLKLEIDQQVINAYPKVGIGYVLASNLDKVGDAEMPEYITQKPKANIEVNDITVQNIAEQQTIKNWRSVYTKCGVKPKTFKPSVEALLRRFMKNKYSPIHNVVDIYNYVSASFGAPMGGYDISQLEDFLRLRYANDDEKFVPLSGNGIEVKKEHIIYADGHETEPVVCWMWNHKDAKRTMLHRVTEVGLFIIDTTTEEERPLIRRSSDLLCEVLSKCGAKIETKGVLTQEHRSIEIGI